MELVGPERAVSDPLTRLRSAGSYAGGSARSRASVTSERVGVGKCL